GLQWNPCVEGDIDRCRKNNGKAAAAGYQGQGIC
ncbi:unnamed protein product, partial [marine sediment metagenome]